MVCDSLVLSINKDDSKKILIRLQEEIGLFDFNKIVKDHRLYCNMNTNVNRKFDIETPDTIYTEKVSALSSKAYAYHTKPIEKEKKT